MANKFFQAYETGNLDLLSECLHPEFDFDSRYEYTGLPKAGLDKNSEFSVKEQYVNMNRSTIQFQEIKYSNLEYIVDPPKIVIIANITFRPKGKVSEPWMQSQSIAAIGYFLFKDGLIYRSTGAQDRLKQFLIWGSVEFTTTQKQKIKEYFKDVKESGLLDYS